MQIRLLRIFLLSWLCVGCIFHIQAHKRDTLSLKELCFVANKGQWEASVLYKAKLNGGVLFAEADRLTIVLPDQNQLSAFYEAKLDAHKTHDGLIDACAYQMIFLNCNQQAHIYGKDILPNHHNYFTSNNPRQWASKVPLYHELVYQQLYQGVDLRFYQQENRLKYEFVIAPGAVPEQIGIQYEGVSGLSLNHGNLIVKTETGQTMELAPLAYQIDESGNTVEIPCQFVIQKNKVNYKLGDYDKGLTLIIDPTLIFSSYSGSAADNWGFTATYDKHGNLYGGGIAFGIGYPTQVGHHYQINYAGGSCDVAISKFDSTGSQLYYSTYLGGTASECPHSLFVNDNDELYVFGTTGSYSFPTTAQAYDQTFNSGAAVTVNSTVSFPYGTDIFIAKFSADGDNLLASTFIGGSSNDGLNTGNPLKKNYADESRGEIIVDQQSNVYIASCTFSDDFPVTAGAFQTTHSGGKDGCVLKMDQNLSHLIWSSYIGGNGDEACYSMDLATDNSVYLCGGTTTNNMATSPTAVQPSYGGGVCDGFVAHISENGDQLLQCSYLGKGDYDQCYLLKLNRNNHPYLFGQTAAAGNSWLTNTFYGQAGGGQFLTHLTPALDSVVWSTAYGTGSGQGPDISPTALLVDLCNTVYMSGWGSLLLNGFGGTQGLPVTADAFQTTTDGSDYYFICLREDGNTPVYASFFGSPNSREHVDGGTSRFDKKGKIYQAICAGCGGDDNFPTTPGAWSETNGSTNCNLGVVKMDFNLPVIIADFHASSIICFPDTLFFQDNSQTMGPGTLYHWDFGDGSSSDEHAPAHQYTQGGIYTVTLSINDYSSCNLYDSISKTILVLTGSSHTLAPQSICSGDFTQIGIAPAAGSDIQYHWTPANTLSNPLISNPIATPTTTTDYQLIITTPYCSDTLYQTVNVEDLQVSVSADTLICLGESVTLQLNVLSGNTTHIVWSQQPNYSNPIAENTQQITVSPTADSHYFLKVDGSYCSFEKEITVQVSAVTIGETTPTLICFEDSVRLSVNASGGNNLQYQWQPAEEISSDGNGPHPWIHPAASVTYTVTVTNEHGCSATASIPVTKRIGTFDQGFEAWCEECEILQSNTTQLFSTPYNSNYQYQWSPANTLSNPTSASTNANPFETTTYTVTVTDEYGCTMTKDVTIEVHPISCDEPLVFIPNTFTPNGDGKNDVLYVRSAIIKEFTFRIYNRWGELIFESNSSEKGWDGSFKGKPCEQGVYDYYLQGICISGENFIKKGNISLIY